MADGNNEPDKGWFRMNGLQRMIVFLALIVAVTVIILGGGGGHLASLVTSTGQVVNPTQ